MYIIYTVYMQFFILQTKRNVSKRVRLSVSRQLIPESISNHFEETLTKINIDFVQYNVNCNSEV